MDNRNGSALGFLTFFLLVTVTACSTVKLSKPDENGQVNAKFKRIKVLSEKYNTYFYQVTLKDLAKLYEDFDNLEFAIDMIMKEPKKEEEIRLRFPFVQTIQKDSGKKVTVISEKEIAPYRYELVFAYSLEELKDKVRRKSNLILSLNGGQMFFVINYQQLKELYKVLVKEGYVIDLD